MADARPEPCRGARRRLLLLGLVACLTGACAAPDDAVTVFAAASLRDVLEPIGREAGERAGVEVRFSFAASSTLARQIEAGAPADIFVSAHRRWMDRLQTGGYIDPATRREALGNYLVLVGAPGEPRLELPAALATVSARRRLALGDPVHVPAGIYAREALVALGLWARLEPHLARADNVRAALALVARGEAPLGIVYATDVAVAPGVRRLARIDADLHSPIVYSFALLEPARARAREVLVALTDADALQRFESAGFARR